ncbi:hypothetical protein [Amycolatopsis pithecellobii]|uniref:Uncharacterized protein n=1 Tax=Amycolatopsis pithecellobii TaxID=664692 RepID=A0A6N7Z3R7_9PSEU|nr:hypothetical protein [Amycolatopsis pithecellobii]MTD55829.1 hypothetical protein [Amycolatopsis pithecellobii]
MKDKASSRRTILMRRSLTLFAALAFAFVLGGGLGGPPPPVISGFGGGLGGPPPPVQW